MLVEMDVVLADDVLANEEVLVGVREVLGVGAEDAIDDGIG